MAGSHPLRQCGFDFHRLGREPGMTQHVGCDPTGGAEPAGLSFVYGHLQQVDLGVQRRAGRGRQRRAVASWFSATTSTWSMTSRSASADQSRPRRPGQGDDLNQARKDRGRRGRHPFATTDRRRRDPESRLPAPAGPGRERSVRVGPVAQRSPRLRQFVPMMLRQTSAPIRITFRLHGFAGGRRGGATRQGCARTDRSAGVGVGGRCAARLHAIQPSRDLVETGEAVVDDPRRDRPRARSHARQNLLGGVQRSSHRGKIDDAGGTFQRVERPEQRCRCVRVVGRAAFQRQADRRWPARPVRVHSSRNCSRIRSSRGARTAARRIPSGFPARPA